MNRIQIKSKLHDFNNWFKDSIREKWRKLFWWLNNSHSRMRMFLWRNKKILQGDLLISPLVVWEKIFTNWLQFASFSIVFYSVWHSWCCLLRLIHLSSQKSSTTSNEEESSCRKSFLVFFRLLNLDSYGFCTDIYFIWGCI